MCVICACVCNMLRRYNEEYALLLALGAGILILWQILGKIQEAQGVFSSFLQAVQDSEEYFAVLWRSVIICVITRFASDSCADAGQKALASQVELAGKAAVVLMALPLFSGLLQVISFLAGD